MQHKAITVVAVIGIMLAALMLVAGSSRFHLPDNQQGYEPDQPIAFSHRLHAGELNIDCQYCHIGAEQGRHAGIPSCESCMTCHRFVTTTFGALRAADEEAQQETSAVTEAALTEAALAEAASPGEPPTQDEPPSEDQAPAEDEEAPIQLIVSDEIQKIYDALAVDVTKGFAPIEDQTPTPIPWVRVHNLPSFAYFDHRAHVTAGVECQYCHGPVETMQRIRQVESLSMGWCVNCHREVNESGLNGQRVNASIDCDACHH